LEREFGLGLGGFDLLTQDQKERLIAYWRVKSDPKNERKPKQKGIAGALSRMAEARKGHKGAR
jgi:hypothetical protein